MTTNTTNVKPSINMSLALNNEMQGMFDTASSYWKLVFRNVLRQRSRNFLLGALIFFASFVIVYFSQFLEGVSRNFSQNLITLATGDIYVSSQIERSVDKNFFDRDYQYFHLPAGFQAQLSSFPDIASVSPRLEFDAKLVTELDVTPYRIMAIDLANEPKLKANFVFTEGRMLKSGEYGIVIPVDFARIHQIHVGDQVRLLTKAVNNRVNLIDYTVTGLFATLSLSAWLDNYAYLDLDVARVLVNDNNALTRLNINLKDKDAAKNRAAVLTDWLKQNPAVGNPPIDVTEWSEGTALFAEMTGAMQLSYMIIIFIIILMVTASLVFSTMLNILERTKEIATLGALGATPRTIRQILVGENLVLAGVSAIAGIVCAGIAFLVTARIGIPINSKELSGFLGSSHFYPAFNLNGYIAGLVVPLAVAFMSSFLFAHRASKLPIADAIADR